MWDQFPCELHHKICTLRPETSLNIRALVFLTLWMAVEVTVVCTHVCFTISAIHLWSFLIITWYDQYSQHSLFTLSSLYYCICRAFTCHFSKISEEMRKGGHTLALLLRLNMPLWHDFLASPPMQKHSDLCICNLCIVATIEKLFCTSCMHLHLPLVCYSLCLQKLIRS